MAFLDPKILKKFYKLLVEKYGNEYESSFKYFKKQWINKKKLGKYTPLWNYYINIKNIEFAQHFLFLTNNISEYISHLLNASFNKKYPRFIDWKDSLLNFVDLFETKTKEIHRKNFSSKIILCYLCDVNLNGKSIK